MISTRRLQIGEPGSDRDSPLLPLARSLLFSSLHRNAHALMIMLSLPDRRRISRIISHCTPRSSSLSHSSSVAIQIQRNTNSSLIICKHNRRLKAIRSRDCFEFDIDFARYECGPDIAIDAAALWAPSKSRSAQSI